MTIHLPIELYNLIAISLQLIDIIKLGMTCTELYKYFTGDTFLKSKYGLTHDNCFYDITICYKLICKNNEVFSDNIYELGYDYVMTLRKYWIFNDLYKITYDNNLMHLINTSKEMRNYSKYFLQCYCIFDLESMTEINYDNSDRLYLINTNSKKILYENTEINGLMLDDEFISEINQLCHFSYGYFSETLNTIQYLFSLDNIYADDRNLVINDVINSTCTKTLVKNSKYLRILCATDKYVYCARYLAKSQLTYHESCSSNDGQLTVFDIRGNEIYTFVGNINISYFKDNIVIRDREQHHILSLNILTNEIIKFKIRK